MSPRERVQAECDRRGRSAVVAGCVEILDGSDIDDGLVLALVGESAEYVLSGHEGGRTGYWPRVWAARALLHTGDGSLVDSDEPGVLRGIVTATSDDSWRVREMAAKVIARHRLAGAFDALVDLQNDAVPRVRTASERALTILAAAAD